MANNIQLFVSKETCVNLTTCQNAFHEYLDSSIFRPTNNLRISENAKQAAGPTQDFSQNEREENSGKTTHNLLSPTSNDLHCVLENTRISAGSNLHNLKTAENINIVASQTTFFLGYAEFFHVLAVTRVC